MNIVHGGNVYEIAAQAGCSPEDILDFSASINPLGPPPGLARVISGCFRRLESYPDIHNRTLIDAVAKFHGVDPECVAVGNGSTELIYWLPRALGIKNALAALPTFGEYAKAFELNGTVPRKLVSSAGDFFQPTVESLAQSLSREPVEAVLLTHPGSPSGTLLDGRLTDWICDSAAEFANTLFIIDEVFIDFCEEESLKRFLDRMQNLVIIRSLTKFYGLPGLRIGYLLANPAIASRVRRHLPPWSVNTLAQTAGAYCFTKDRYRRRTLELVGKERKRLSGELSAIPGLEVFPGRANYLLVRLAPALPAASALKREVFHADRILIRDCGSFEGLDDRYFRVAVRLPAQNDRLIEALKRGLSG